MVKLNLKLDKLNKKIINCKKCPRLVSYIHDVSEKKVRRFKDERYWGKPLAGFGDINAKLLILGLAPAAHGGNRTGRMFTGDSSATGLQRHYTRTALPRSPQVRVQVMDLD